MKLRMDNIDIYNGSALILNNNNPFYSRIWISVLIILTILFMFISFIPFNIYKIARSGSLRAILLTKSLNL